MTALESVYQASHIKRSRATKHEVIRRRIDLLTIVADMKPMTVRQVYYQATVRGLVEKTEAGYDKVQTDLAEASEREMLKMFVQQGTTDLTAGAA